MCISQGAETRMKTAFITGVTGQDGAYLAQFLLTKGYKVYGGRRRSSQDDKYRLRTLGLEDKITFLNFDITDVNIVVDIVKSGQFNEIYNLAGQSFVGASWDIPHQTTLVNANGVVALIDAIKRFSPKTSFYQASTSEMFGMVQEDLQSETTPFYPRSPYGVSKLYAHWITKNYRESFGLHFCSGILFNHESPLRGHEFVTQKVVTQLAEIKQGKRAKLILGNLNAKRDWGYAKEYVESMWLMLQNTNPDDFVIATGTSTPVRDFVTFAAESLDINLIWDGSGVNERGIEKNTGKIIVEVSPKFFRPAEVDVLVGNPKKALDILNWKSTMPIRELAELMSESAHAMLKSN